MQGIVEVYKLVNGVETLIERSDNLLVDGFGKTIADIMTITPSLSAIASASSILDASSYRINAISFGKDTCGYTTNAHAPSVKLGNSTGTSKLLTVIAAGDTGSESLTYFPNVLGIPEPPSPEDTRLERRSTQTAAEAALSFLQDREQWNAGQNTNLLGTSAIIASSRIWTALVGCYSPSTGIHTQFVTPDDTLASGGTAIAALLINPGNFNSNNNIDVSGFINLQNLDGVANSEAYNASTGLLVSASPAGDFSSTGEVDYVLYINGPDLACNSLYGGIWTAGLWTLDVPAMLVSGTNPPFGFRNMTNNRVYRLVNKKVFMDDLCANEAAGAPLEGGIERLNNVGHSVKIVWRIIF